MTQNVKKLIDETMNSYYEYVVKIEDGCTVISTAFLNEDVHTGVTNIQLLSEGLSWLVEVENLMQMHAYQIESPIRQAVALFEKINDAISSEDFGQVGTLFESELKPLFKNASDWKFKEVVR